MKYQRYLVLRHSIQANKPLWKRIQDGTAEATVVVIEHSFYIDAIAYRLTKEGADLGYDVTFEQMLREAALCMIDHAPIMRLSEMTTDLVVGVIPRPHYSATAVYKQIGEKFNDAAVFAARAHATFDIDDLDRATSTNDLFFGPYKGRLVMQFGSIDRVFDKEHPKSAAMLNEMMLSYDDLSNNTGVRPHISESDSESNVALQAADFCAGFASELMMNAAADRERELRRHFRRVIFNGATR